MPIASTPHHHPLAHTFTRSMPNAKAHPPHHSHPHWVVVVVGGHHSTQPQGQPHCHRCGLHWSAPRGIPGDHQSPCQGEHEQPQPMPMTITKQHHGQLPRGTSPPPRHAQLQACQAQVPVPMPRSRHQCHAQDSLGAASQPAPLTPECIPMAFLKQPGVQPPCPPSSAANTPQPHIWVCRGPADCALGT